MSLIGKAATFTAANMGISVMVTIVQIIVYLLAPQQLDARWLAVLAHLMVPVTGGLTGGLKCA